VSPVHVCCLLKRKLSFRLARTYTTSSFPSYLSVSNQQKRSATRKPPRDINSPSSHSPERNTLKKTNWHPESHRQKRSHRLGATTRCRTFPTFFNSSNVFQRPRYSPVRPDGSIHITFFRQKIDNCRRTAISIVITSAGGPTR